MDPAESLQEDGNFAGDDDLFARDDGIGGEKLKSDILLAY
jgi:hypothetical protein